MNKNSKKVAGASIAIVIVAVIVLVGFYLLSQGKFSFKRGGTSQTASEIMKLKEKDLALKYPSTPTEVVRLYWRMNKCIYNSSMKEKDLKAILTQMRLLYDEELLNEEGNSLDDMLKEIKTDKESFQKENRIISSYTVDKETAVEYSEVDKRECATLTSSILEDKKSEKTRSYARFLCRKDDDGKWKILGWEQIPESEATAGK